MLFLFIEYYWKEVLLVKKTKMIKVCYFIEKKMNINHFF